jgi:Fur family transcriptional regulator, ferric uptake regulator
MLDKFHELLREHGRSVTKSRSLLFQYLQKSGPVSVSKFMRDNTAVADRASLYRTLIMFRELRVIEDRIIRGKRLVELTDDYDSHHHHLTCNNCGKSIAITMPGIEQQLVELCREYGFEADGHVIEANGLCADCRRMVTATPGQQAQVIK